MSSRDPSSEEPQATAGTEPPDDCNGHAKEEFSSDPSTYLEQVFTFIVGEHRDRHMVRHATFASLSAPLANLMDQRIEGLAAFDKPETIDPKATLEEVLGRSAVLRYVDDATFKRVHQWALTKEYSPEVPFIDNALPEGFTMEMMAQMESDEAQRAQANAEATTHATATTSPSTFLAALLQIEPSKLWEQFLAEAAPDSFAPLNPRALDNYTNVFLSHARVYVFAEAWAVAPLQQHALLALRRVLARFVVHDTRLADVVALLQFVYTHTNPACAAADNAINPLRRAVAYYAACIVDKLLRHGPFRAFLQSNGAFAVDFPQFLVPEVREARSWYTAAVLADASSLDATSAGVTEL